MSEKVRAKFFVQGVEIQNVEAAGPTGKVRLSAVTRGEENKNWSHYTPYGTIEMSTLNPAALKVFLDRIGEEFFIDFTPAGTRNGVKIG